MSRVQYKHNVLLGQNGQSKVNLIGRLKNCMVSIIKTEVYSCVCVYVCVRACMRAYVCVWNTPCTVWSTSLLRIWRKWNTPRSNLKLLSNKFDVHILYWKSIAFVSIVIMCAVAIISILCNKSIQLIYCTKYMKLCSYHCTFCTQVIFTLLQSTKFWVK